MFLICDAEYSNMQTRYYSLLQNIDCSPLERKAISTSERISFAKITTSHNFDPNTLKLELTFPQVKQLRS